MVSSSLDVWVAAILMLCIYSMLCGPNRFFKFAEHVFVGTSTGFVVVQTIGALDATTFTPIMHGETLWAFVLIFGLLVYFRISKKYSWLSRWPVALVVGVGTSVVISTIVSSQVLSQIGGIALPLVANNPLSTVNNWITIIGALTTLAYFMFSMKRVQESRAFNRVHQIGRFFLLIALGSSFGAGFASYIVQLVERMVFLVRIWLGIG